MQRNEKPRRYDKPRQYGKQTERTIRQIANHDEIEDVHYSEFVKYKESKSFGMFIVISNLQIKYKGPRATVMIGRHATSMHIEFPTKVRVKD